MIKLLKPHILSAAAVMALGSFAASANAAPITFTWNPSVVTGVAGEQVTANNINIADFAYANIASNGSFTESGVLEITQFQNGAFPVNSPDLLSTNGYALYFTFNASGTIANWNPANPGGTGYVGSINSLNYTFLIDPTNNDSIVDSGTTYTLMDGSGNDGTLATGTKSNAGLNQVTLNSGIPGANATETFVPNPTNAGFFVAPAAANYLSLLIEDSFTNTPGVATLSSSGGTATIRINGGGGNADFAVPEPATLSLFGAGLLALAFAKRRRNQTHA